MEMKDKGDDLVIESRNTCPFCKKEDTVRVDSTMVWLNEFAHADCAECGSEWKINISIIGGTVIEDLHNPPSDEQLLELARTKDTSDRVYMNGWLLEFGANADQARRVESLLYA